MWVLLTFRLQRHILPSAEESGKGRKEQIEKWAWLGFSGLKKKKKEQRNTVKSHIIVAVDFQIYFIVSLLHKFCFLLGYFPLCPSTHLSSFSPFFLIGTEGKPCSPGNYTKIRNRTQPHCHGHLTQNHLLVQTWSTTIGFLARGRAGCHPGAW